MDENNENGVTVAVRIRPLLKHENKYIIQTIDNEPQVSSNISIFLFF